MAYPYDGLRYPEEWEEIEGVWVRDPDGWRNNNIPWDMPISHATWQTLSGVSTIEIMPGRNGRPRYSATENRLRIKAQTDTLSRLMRGR